MNLGKNVSLEKLTEKYDAVYLGMGVGLTRTLGIKGEELEGVVDAIDFIYTLRDKGYSACSCW